MEEGVRKVVLTRRSTSNLSSKARGTTESNAKAAETAESSPLPHLGLIPSQTQPNYKHISSKPTPIVPLEEDLGDGDAVSTITSDTPRAPVVDLAPVAVEESVNLIAGPSGDTSRDPNGSSTETNAGHEQVLTRQHLPLRFRGIPGTNSQNPISELEFRMRDPL